jgi:hypothetical protein
VPGALHRLAGLQAQQPLAPYTGLWARLEGFAPQALARELEARRAVRIVAMRSTIHLLTAQDAAVLRPLTQVASERAFASNHGKRLAGADPEAVAAAARELVEDEPLTFAELAERLAPRWPDAQAEALAMAARAHLPLVQIPPRGVWGAGGLARHTTLRAWTGGAIHGDTTPAELVLRHLAAFGPATVADVQAWAGVTRLAPVVAALRERLVVLRSEDGAELFDLPDAPRPDPETPAPVRFLPEYDNVLVGHADRSRIVTDRAHQRRAFTRGTVLVDGMLAAAWKPVRERGDVRIDVEPFAKLTRAQRAEVDAEAERLRAFLLS